MSDKTSVARAWVDNLHAKIAALPSHHAAMELTKEIGNHMLALQARYPDLYFEAHEAMNRGRYWQAVKNWPAMYRDAIIDHRADDDPARIADREKKKAEKEKANV